MKWDELAARCTDLGKAEVLCGAAGGIGRRSSIAFRVSRQ